MTKTAVIEAALKLPQKQRTELVDRLIESMDGPDDRKTPEQWLKEINRRVAQVKSGKAKSKPSERVVAELRRKYRI